VKLTKNKIKEMIFEVLTEENVMDKKIKYKDKDGNSKEATVGGILKQGENHPAYKDAKAMTSKGGSEKEKKGSTNINIDADPFSGDVGGPAHPNVPKDKPKRPKAMDDLDWDNEIEPDELENWIVDNQKKIPPSSMRAINGWMDDYEEYWSEQEYDHASAVQYKMKRELERYMRESKNESIKESKIKRFTVKEVHRWMKTLEENRYRKIVNADARRVAWLVNNNLSEDYESMPKTMRKKWSKAQYGRERYLATEFLKSKKSEQKLRESIREIIKEHLNEVKKQNAIDVARKVVKTKQYDKANGLDLTTANFIVQVYDSQKKNPAVQKKLAKMSVVQLSKVIGKLLR